MESARLALFLFRKILRNRTMITAKSILRINTSHMKKFNTVLFQVHSPQNVGMIIRSHVAFGGETLVFVGYDQPWSFKSGTQGFSRKLEKKCRIEYFVSPVGFFEWSKQHEQHNIAIEISSNSKSVINYNYPTLSNIIVGNERTGIPASFLENCDDILHIPQLGEVECLNVAVSASIVLFDFAKANNIQSKSIQGSKFNLSNTNP